MLDALGISLPKLIFTIVNFAILLFILAKFLYKPFLNILRTRRESIRSALENAEMTNRKADEKMASYERKIAGAEEEGREIIRNSNRRAKEQAAAIIEEANEEAAQILEKARLEIEREKQHAAADMREQVGSLALLVAEKIMEREIEVNGQEEILDQVIREVGTSEWQN